MLHRHVQEAGDECAGGGTDSTGKSTNSQPLSCQYWCSYGHVSLWNAMMRPKRSRCTGACALLIAAAWGAGPFSGGMLLLQLGCGFLVTPFSIVWFSGTIPSMLVALLRACFCSGNRRRCCRRFPIIAPS